MTEENAKRKPKLDKAVTFTLGKNKHHTHRGIRYVDGDVALVDQAAAAKLEKRKLAKPGGEARNAKNAHQAKQVNG